MAAAAVSNGTSEVNAQKQAQPRRAHASAWEIRHWNHRLRRYRAGTRRWLTVIRGRPAPPISLPREIRTRGRFHVLARKWRHREHAAWRRANHPPDLGAWMCIHHYEGSWTDSGSPYWGGLQMDMSFQQSYGGWLLQHRGTADHWSPLEQMWVAVRAWRVRGFSPWPNTARDCGVY